MAFLIAAYLWWVKKESLSPIALVVVGSILCFIAAFRTWEKENNLVEALEKQRGIPKIYLRHVNPTGDRFTDTSGFFVQVEGPKKAFGVRIESPDTVDKDHWRLEWLWSAVNEPVGNDPVLVEVLCSSRQGSAASSVVGSQLEHYRRIKATEPKDLIATIKYRDVDGEECPPRKFRIYVERDLTGHLKTFCDLIRD